MNKSAWEQSQDVEAMVRIASKHTSCNELVSIAIEYCQEVLALVPGQIAPRLLEAARSRVDGSLSPNSITTIRIESDALYQQLYPGFGSPSPAALALTAIGELVFTQDDTQAAATSLLTAAEAKAVAAGLAVPDDLYDQVHDATFERESQRQAALIRARVDPFG